MFDNMFVILADTVLLPIIIVALIVLNLWPHRFGGTPRGADFGQRGSDDHAAGLSLADPRR